jgi:hypothetical protein
LLLSVRDFTWGHGDCQAMLFMSMRDGVFPSKHSPHRTNGLLRKVRSQWHSGLTWPEPASPLQSLPTLKNCHCEERSLRRSNLRLDGK